MGMFIYFLFINDFFIYVAYIHGVLLFLLCSIANECMLFANPLLNTPLKELEKWASPNHFFFSGSQFFYEYPIMLFMMRCKHLLARKAHCPLPFELLQSLMPCVPSEAPILCFYSQSLDQLPVNKSVL